MTAPAEPAAPPTPRPLRRLLGVGLSWGLLGLEFLATGLLGDLSGWFVGVLSLAMGVGPFVLWWRSGPRELLLGSHDLQGRVSTPSITGVLLGPGVPLVAGAAGAALAGFIVAVASTGRPGEASGGGSREIRRAGEPRG